MKTARLIMIPIVIVISLAATAQVRNDNGIDPEALIERMLAVEKAQRESIKDVVFDAEYIEGETQKDGIFKEEVRFIKKIYIKYLPDTALFHEEFLEYFKDGEKQSDKNCLEEGNERREKKIKRRSHDASYSMLKPFQPDFRQEYEIEYLGVATERIEDHVCHHFRVHSLIEDQDHINGDYFIEAESFHLVRVDFTPAKLVKKMMFKLKQLDMTLTYAADSEGRWLPHRFDIRGKGRAAFFFGVKFEGTEYYRNPIVNGGVNDELFREGDDN